VYTLLNLAATEEDHGETGNIKDFTMRAGGQKKSLPLMRRFNEHSERLLEQTMGHQDPKNRNLAHAHGGNAGDRKYYDDILLDDLQGEETEDLIPLNVQERESLFEGMAATEPDMANKKRKRLTEEEEEAIFNETKEAGSIWEPDLPRFSFPASKLALSSLQSNINSRLSNSASSSIANSKLFPEQVLRSMISCQASANEFLRHFWSAVLPAQTGDISASAMANPQQRAGKATRMIEYLRKTQERVDTVVKEGEKLGGDPNAVREALQPCLQAVRKAVKYYSDRVSK
jgi:transcription initiation factor TFIIH subunit 1